MTIQWKYFVGLLLILSAATACSSSTKTASTTSKAPKTTTTHLSQAQEVSGTTCSSPDAINVVYVKGSVHNTSSKRSDYTIEVVVVAGDGTQIGTGTALVQNVEPGQKAVWSAITDTDTARFTPGTTCKVAKVERDASL